jgi:hypothetical protein
MHARGRHGPKLASIATAVRLLAGAFLAKMAVVFDVARGQDVGVDIARIGAQAGFGQARLSSAMLLTASGTRDTQ